MPDLLDEIRRQVDEERLANLTKYREILVRADHPEPNDAASLRVLLGRLGFTPDRLGADLRVLKQAADLEGQAAAADLDLDAKVNAASDRWLAHKKESERIAGERKKEGDRLFGEVTSLQRRQSEAKEKAKELQALRTAHREVFGLPPVAPPEPPRAGMIFHPENQPVEKGRPAVVRTVTPRMMSDGSVVCGGSAEELAGLVPAVVTAELPPLDDDESQADVNWVDEDPSDGSVE